jgi:hypothetical protein
MEVQGSPKTKEKTMKSPKKWYLAALLVVVLALATAATRVKGDSSGGGLERFQADGIAALNASNTGSTGTIKGNEIGTATIADAGYAQSFLGFTGNAGDACVLGGGIITITTKDGSTLNMARSGMDCDISGPGLIGGNTGNHVYVITGGTGRFAGATGNGNYTFSVNNGVVLIHINGNIQIAGGGDQD